MTSKKLIPDEILDAVAGGYITYKGKKPSFAIFFGDEIHIETDEGKMCFVMKEEKRVRGKVLRGRETEYALEDICHPPVPSKRL